jgi:hypothetical protein
MGSGSWTFENIKWVITSGSGTLILAGMLVLAWRNWRKNGNGNGQVEIRQTATMGNAGASYFELRTLVDEVRRLGGEVIRQGQLIQDVSRQVADYHRAAERTERYRHEEQDEWHSKTQRLLEETSESIRDVGEWIEKREKPAA